MKRTLHFFFNYDITTYQVTPNKSKLNTAQFIYYNS